MLAPSISSIFIFFLYNISTRKGVREGRGEGGRVEGSHFGMGTNCCVDNVRLCGAFWLLKGMICMLAVEWRGRGNESAAGRKTRWPLLKTTP